MIQFECKTMGRGTVTSIYQNYTCGFSSIYQIIRLDFEVVIRNNCGFLIIFIINIPVGFKFYFPRSEKEK